MISCALVIFVPLTRRNGANEEKSHDESGHDDARRLSERRGYTDELNVIICLMRNVSTPTPQNHQREISVDTVWLTSSLHILTCFGDSLWLSQLTLSDDFSSADSLPLQTKHKFLLSQTLIIFRMTTNVSIDL